MSSQPYIGLRPFERDETDIFFGREQHSYELIDRLGSRHFLAVVGTSGCGKSSLIKTGLIAGLEAGYLATTGTHWRIVEMRPGNHPFQALADKLFNELNDVLAAHYTADTLQQALRQGSLSLHELLAQHPLPNNAQVLIVCDQFEEIFRYAKEGSTAEARNFVSLLLASSKPYPLSTTELSQSIYVVITMRSDFLSDCAQFAGLAEAINQGLYLTPRLDAQQLRTAIEEPAFMFDGEIEPALVMQLLEDAQNNQDQLPLLQHVLMRLWDLATDKTAPLTLANYEAIGGFANALSRHANEVYDGLTDEQKQIAEILFRSLTERGDTQRDTRRPIQLAKIIELTGASQTEVVAVIDAFRQVGRCFLMPPINVTLDNDSIIDISHESLIRQWQRLKDWTEDEAKNAKIYQRLMDDALRYQEKKNSLLQSPELEIVSGWYKKFKPTEIWAERYGGNFNLVNEFLEKSKNYDFAKKLILFLILFPVCLISIVSSAKKIYVDIAPYLIDKAVQVQLEEKDKVIAQKDIVIEEKEKSINQITDTAFNAVENIPDRKTKEMILLEMNNASLFIKQGKKYLDQKILKDALISFNKALEIDLNNKLALYYIGLTYKELDQFDSAMSSFEKYFSVTGDNKTNWDYYNLWVYFYIGDIYSSKEKFNKDKAIDNYKKAVNSKPKDKNLALALYRIGKLYEHIEQFDQASSYFKDYTDIVQDSESGYYRLGLVSEKLKKYDEAMDAYKKVIQLNPKNIDAKKRLERLSKYTVNLYRNKLKTH
jgi:tetratricopeptide (TPR) repeat protein